jgi:hypothetical protein
MRFTSVVDHTRSKSCSDPLPHFETIHGDKHASAPLLANVTPVLPARVLSRTIPLSIDLGEAAGEYLLLRGM